MERKLKSYFLLVVSILMLVASVFPHHHHDLYFCVAHDLETCPASVECPDHLHHTGDEDNHACTSSCVTHFAFSAPDSHGTDLSPAYSYSLLIYPFLLTLERLSSFENDLPCPYSVYIERLHARHFVASSGLRAPPCKECPGILCNLLARTILYFCSINLPEGGRSGLSVPEQ